MSKTHNLTVATIQEHCRGLRLPTVAAQSERLAQEAERANQSHLNYLAELLGAEMEERERHTIERRIKEARLPRMKTLEEFDFSAAPHISATSLLGSSRSQQGLSCTYAWPTVFQQTCLGLPRSTRMSHDRRGCPLYCGEMVSSQ